MYCSPIGIDQFWDLRRGRVGVPSQPTHHFLGSRAFPLNLIFAPYFQGSKHLNPPLLRIQDVRLYLPIGVVVHRYCQDNHRNLLPPDPPKGVDCFQQ